MDLFQRSLGAFGSEPSEDGRGQRGCERFGFALRRSARQGCFGRLETGFTTVVAPEGLTMVVTPEGSVVATVPSE